MLWLWKWHMLIEVREDGTGFVLGHNRFCPPRRAQRPSVSGRGPSRSRVAAGLESEHSTMLKGPAQAQYLRRRCNSPKVAPVPAKRIAAGTLMDEPMGVREVQVGVEADRAIWAKVVRAGHRAGGGSMSRSAFLSAAACDGFSHVRAYL
jgi:hypothetical protein